MLSSVGGLREGVYSGTALLGSAGILPDFSSYEQDEVIALLTSLAH